MPAKPWSLRQAPLPLRLDGHPPGGSPAPATAASRRSSCSITPSSPPAARWPYCPKPSPRRSSAPSGTLSSRSLTGPTWGADAAFGSSGSHAPAAMAMGPTSLTRPHTPTRFSGKWCGRPSPPRALSTPASSTSTMVLTRASAGTPTTRTFSRGYTSPFASPRSPWAPPALSNGAWPRTTPAQAKSNCALAIFC